ncbi:MAG: hypothetical protein GMKNLPBB_01390 [Myxococcota bacterium]|nr:hypothetical protein [Myxococcota bacterium]
MKTRLTLALTMMALFTLIPMAVFAQDEAPVEEGGATEPTVKYKETTVIDFEGDTISGDLAKPDGEYLESRKRARHQNLIRIREDFNSRVLKEANTL